MADYRVDIKPSAQKELEKLHPKVIQRVFAAIAGLESDPRPPGCKKLKGGTTEWRIKVGDYRIVYTIDDTKARVTVTRIRHRSDAYA